MGAGYADLTSTAVNVGAGSTLILAENKMAMYRLIQNDDESEDMWIRVGAAAVAHEGIFLPPKGSFEMSRENGNLDTRAIYAIHAGEGNKVILVTQGV